MALQMFNAIKRITASGGGTLVVPAGKSYRVKAIYCNPSTNDTFLSVFVDKMLAAYWRVKGKSGNHLGGISPNKYPFNLMDYLVQLGYPLMIPLAQGQILTVVRYGEAGDVQILYDIYDSVDVQASEPNGTLANRFCFLQYMTASTVLTASGDQLLDTQLTPPEFPAFPCGKPVNTGFQVKVHGIIGSPCASQASGSGQFYSTFFKMMQDREILFDEDRNGIAFIGNSAVASAADYSQGQSLIIPATDYDPSLHVHTENTAATYTQNATTQKATMQGFGKGRPYLLKTPLVFAAGEWLSCFITYVMSGTVTMAANLADIALLLEVTQV